MPKDLSAANLLPIRILLVEDDAQVARVNRELLERDAAVHVIGTASSCQEADALMQVLKPDLILLDVHLPDGNGLGLLRHWRTHGLTTDVALITAADDESSIRIALAHGAFDYLIKPFTGSRLTELLARHRARHNAAPLTLTPEAARYDQASLDRLLGMAGNLTPAGAQAEPLPRGIDHHTLERLAQALERAGAGLSAEDIGEIVGLSRVTAWRYLEYLVRVGRAEIDHHYGNAGRPAKLYRWVTE